MHTQIKFNVTSNLGYQPFYKREVGSDNIAILPLFQCNVTCDCSGLQFKWLLTKIIMPAPMINSTTYWHDSKPIAQTWASTAYGGHVLYSTPPTARLIWTLEAVATVTAMASLSSRSKHQYLSFSRLKVSLRCHLHNWGIECALC